MSGKKTRFFANTVISSYSLLIRLTLEIIFGLFAERIHICTHTSVAEAGRMCGGRWALGCRCRGAGPHNPNTTPTSSRTKGFPGRKVRCYPWRFLCVLGPWNKNCDKRYKTSISPPFIPTFLGLDSDGRMHSKPPNA